MDTCVGLMHLKDNSIINSTKIFCTPKILERWYSVSHRKNAAFKHMLLGRSQLISI